MSAVRCDTCQDTGRVPWMIEGDPHCYQEPDEDGTLPCPDCDASRRAPSEWTDGWVVRRTDGAVLERRAGRWYSTARGISTPDETVERWLLGADAAILQGPLLLDPEPPFAPMPGYRVVMISRMIDGAYPEGLDPEAHRWRRVMKVSEEVGEVTEALLGLVGENPRKGHTHTPEDVQRELLDVAAAALAAVAHLNGNAFERDPLTLLYDHLRTVHDRLADTLATQGADHG